MVTIKDPILDVLCLLAAGMDIGLAIRYLQEDKGGQAIVQMCFAAFLTLLVVVSP